MASLSLESLDLSGIPMSSIPLRETGDKSPLHGLRTLVWSESSLKEWRSIDHLVAWCPNLGSLRFGLFSNDLDDRATEEEPRAPVHLTPSITGDDQLDRPIFIAKIASLHKLNLTTIKSDERRDAEMTYVKLVSQLLVSAQSSEDDWGRYAELKKLHGITDTARSVPANGASSLRAKMISASSVSDC